MDTIEKIVEDILKEYSIARKDDWILYGLVVNKINPECMYKSFKDVIKNHLEYRLPAFESVSRCRRKLQATNEDLVNNDMKAKRNEYEEIYKSYAKK